MANEKRLIDPEQAKQATYEEIFWTESEQAVVRNFLAKLPKVDAVEVVRCKGCKFGEPSINAIGEPSIACNNIHIGFYGWLLSEDDFCSYGERKDKE